MASDEHDAGPVDDAPDGGMRQIELAGRKVLLIRDGGACRALAATCPHAGGPLAEGVRHGRQVICPWHKAAFDIDTGALCEPPAVDAIARHAARIEAGRILVTLTDEPDARATISAPRTAGSEPVFAIIGAGPAGEAVARTLREEGFGGRVVMISREDRVPYDRTLLSKYTLSGKQGGEKTPLQEPAFYTRHGIERMVAEVETIDAANHRIKFANGATLDYAQAILASGGEPKPLDVPGAGLGGVFRLRTPGDAEAIVAAAQAGRRAVIVGSGFIGMEAAASLCERGLSVTVVTPEKLPFERRLGAEIGGVFQRLHASKGVRFRTGAEVERIDGDGNARAVVLKDGERLSADLVVVGLGITSATRPLRGFALREDGGIAVDRHLQIAPHLFAAGDIAAFPHRGDGPPIRVEHWRVAQQHGRIAALNMLGRAVPYDAVPVFWTIHFLKRLDYVGHAERWDEIVIDGDLAKPEFVALYVRDRTVAAVAGWDRDKQMAAAVGLMTDRRDWSASELLERLRAIA